MSYSMEKKILPADENEALFKKVQEFIINSKRLCSKNQKSMI